MIRTKIQIRWSDIDQLGHVYNGQYQHFYDIGKSDYFEQVLALGHNWAESGEGFLTVRTLNNYYAPVEMHEDIEVHTTVSRIGTKSFDMEQVIVNSHTGEKKSDSHSVIVCYNPLTKSTYPITDRARAILTEELSLLK